MAHFAQLDTDNKVIQVIVVSNADCTLDGEENETVGVMFCKSLFGQHTKWKQTSYNGNIRKNYAGVGFTYDAQRDAFIPPKPYPSWVLDEETCRWGAPVSYPTDGAQYMWDEERTMWKNVAAVEDTAPVSPEDYPPVYSGDTMPGASAGPV